MFQKLEGIEREMKQNSFVQSFISIELITIIGVNGILLDNIKKMK